MPLHVLQLGPVPPPEGGISRNIFSIREELLLRGDRCSIIATSRSSVEVEEPDIYYPRTKPALLQLLRRLDFDVLHLHIGGDVSRRVLSLALVCSFLAKSRCVLTMHSGGYASTANVQPLFFAGTVFRRFTKLIAVNNDLADVFRRFGVSGEKIEVILPFALKQPDKNVTVPTHLKDFCNRHSPLFVAVGGLEKDYDPLMQIEAMKEIVKTHPKAGLVIVGDGSMRKEVESAVATSGIADSMCVAGNVDHAVTLHLINDADVMLRTTLFDGDAISVREALFLGTPVIATDNGMRPEGVHLIPVGDKRAFVEKVAIALSQGRERTTATSPGNSNILEVIKLYETI